MAAACAQVRRRNAPCRVVLRFPGRSWSLLAFERRSSAVWPWASLRPCPARRPRGGRAARARGTRGSSRQTLAARPALAVAILFSFAHQAKVRRRWREQEIPAAVAGRPIMAGGRPMAREHLPDRGRVGAKHHQLDDAMVLTFWLTTEHPSKSTTSPKGP